jgi:threonyl-tRNA synthetase
MKNIIENRDHRKLGKELDLYSFSEEVGAGLVSFHPNGSVIRYELERFSQKAHLQNGYEWVYSPHIGKAGLWKTSGHLDFFKENMYAPIKIDEEEYYLKPMNCPFHLMIFKNRQRSYQELPVRYAEFGTVYRYEFSGALHGLKRVRGFVQDDAHIICSKDQIYGEILRALKFSLYVLRAFGLNKFKAYIATKPPEKAIGGDSDWDMAVEHLKKAVNEVGLEYEIDEGGGAFYGPKIDIKIIDFAGNEWQCSTVQFDFNLPGKFKMEYRGSDGKFHIPYLVHRALFGSFERFIAVLLEFYSGSLPFWLSPVQVMVIDISSNRSDHCKKLVRKLKEEDVRVELSDNNDSLSSRIRNAELRKIPLILIVGDKEVERNEVSVRCRFDPKLKGSYSYDKLLEIIKIEQSKGTPQIIFED